MAEKYYAVRKGRTTGIYKVWEDCKLQVDGYAGAEFKSFKTMEEAERYIIQDRQLNDIIYKRVTKTDEDSEEDTVTAYVDGSYNKDNPGCFSYGMIILDKGEELKYNKKLEDDILAKMHNVAGEIAGAMAAMQYALDNHKKRVIIYHDYEGIAKWCTGEWRTNKEGTVAYKKFYDEAVKRIRVDFIKVRGHSGDKYNDMADELAKSAMQV